MAFRRSSTEFVWLDVESGGIELSQPIIQVAFVATGPMPKFEVLEELEVKIQFDPAKCDPEALHVNSYDPEVWAREAVPLSTAVALMADFLERHSSREMTSQKGNTYYIAKGAGHNIASFDIPRIRAAFDAEGTFFPLSYQCLDTLHFFVALHWLRGKDLKSYSMDNLAKLFQIEAGGHDALSDVHANIELMRLYLTQGAPE